MPVSYQNALKIKLDMFSFSSEFFIELKWLLFFSKFYKFCLREICIILLKETSLETKMLKEISLKVIIVISVELPISSDILKPTLGPEF